MSQDWRDCGAVAFNVRTMMDKAHLSRRCSMLIITVYSMAVAVYVSVIVEFNRIHSDDLGNEEQQLFLKMQFPFDHDISPVREIVMFVQFIQLLSNASVIGMLDALVITLVSISLAPCRAFPSFMSVKDDFRSLENHIEKIVNESRHLSN